MVNLCFWLFFPIDVPISNWIGWWKSSRKPLHTCPLMIMNSGMYPCLVHYPSSSIFLGYQKWRASTDVSVLISIPAKAGRKQGPPLQFMLQKGPFSMVQHGFVMGRMPWRWLQERGPARNGSKDERKGATEQWRGIELATSGNIWIIEYLFKTKLVLWTIVCCIFTPEPNPSNTTKHQKASQRHKKDRTHKAPFKSLFFKKRCINHHRKKQTSPKKSPMTSSSTSTFHEISPPGEGSAAGDGWRSQGGGPCRAHARFHLWGTWMGGEGEGGENGMRLVVHTHTYIYILYTYNYIHTCIYI